MENPSSTGLGGLAAIALTTHVQVVPYTARRACSTPVVSPAW